MSTKTIERELAALKRRVSVLESKGTRKRSGAWKEVFGMAKMDDLFSEAMRLGSAWRKSANRKKK